MNAQATISMLANGHPHSVATADIDQLALVLFLQRKKVYNLLFATSVLHPWARLMYTQSEKASDTECPCVEKKRKACNNTDKER